MNLFLTPDSVSDDEKAYARGTGIHETRAKLPLKVRPLMWPFLVHVPTEGSPT